MGTSTGPVKLVKAGFVQLDATNAKPKIIVFQYNPETLIRRLEGAIEGAALPATHSLGTPAAGGIGAGAGGGASAGASAGAAAGAANVVQAEPRETVSFTIALDATDKLEAGDPVTQQNGVFPALSALELLMYPKPGTLTVWVSGGRRVLPVRISGLMFNEQGFDRALNPIRAEVGVSLQVLKDADLPANSHGRALWDAHFAVLQQLAQVAFDAGSLTALGLTGI
jgi:hypothetical protein